MRIQLLLLWILFGYSSIAQTISTNPISGSYCQGNSISVSFTVSGTFTSGNSFVLQMSDAAGTFDNPIDIGILYGTTSGTIIGTLPASVTTSSNYLFRVISSLPNVIGTDNGIGITVNGVLTDPMTFGNNQWFVHAYNGYNLTTSALPYLGYYSDGNLNINTATNWPILESPSSAAGFNGCFVPYDNHTVSFRRRGFPCDYYTINISALDNNSGKLLINGTQVWASPTAIGNVWSGFLGPNSKVELVYRESTGNSRAVVNFNTPNFPVLSGNMITCPNNNFNIVASGAPNYTWTSAPYAISGTNAATLTVNAPSAAAGTTQTYTVTTNDTTGCSSTNSVNVTFSNLPLTTVTPTTDAICLGGNTVAVASGADSYSWSPTTGVSNPTGSNVTITPTVTTTYTVTGTTCGATASATLTINVASPVGDTSLFGTNVWNAYCYNGSDLNTNLTSYAGYYVDNGLSFDSNTKWPTATTPSNAAGYTGCYVETDYHTVKYKRKGFPCGYYSFNVGSVDNVAKLIVDGVTVWASPAAQGTIYNGFLGPNSEVVLIWRETTGNSRARLTLTNTNYPSVSTAVTVCAGSSVTLEASNGPNYQWVTNFNYTTGPYNTSTLTVSPPLGTPNSTQTYTVVSTDALTGCKDSNKVVVTINPSLTVTVNPTTGNTCSAGFINATASGASTYTWSPMTGVILNNASGSSVTLDPPTSTVYTVTGSNGCNTNSKTVTITVPSGLGDTTVYGNYSWNVYAYNGTNANMNLNTYKGYYTVNGMSFESDDSFALGSNPSTAPGYQGCPVSNDNHSVQYKRQGFPCGYYRIGAVGVGNLVGYDNTAKLKINGVTVWNSPTAPITNIWQGFLGPNSKVDYIWVELTGNSVGRLTFTPIPYPTTSPDVTINAGSSTTLTASGAPNFDWNHNTTFTSGPYNTNALTVTVPDGTPSQTQVYTVTSFDPGTNCTISSTINVNIVFIDPLPVELINFEAVCNESNTIFNWSTASERNNAYFEIETSNDGISFYPKTQIAGAGNANFVNNYSVSLNLNDLYVRLTQTDVDGKKTIFNPISLPNCLGNQTTDALIYPNPNQGVFNILYTGNKAQIENVQIIDATGKVIYKDTELKDQLDVSLFENGFYQLVITQTKGVIHKSFIKN